MDGRRDLLRSLVDLLQAATMDQIRAVYYIVARMLRR